MYLLPLVHFQIWSSEAGVQAGNVLFLVRVLSTFVEKLRSTKLKCISFLLEEKPTNETYSWSIFQHTKRMSKGFFINDFKQL